MTHLDFIHTEFINACQEALDSFKEVIDKYEQALKEKGDDVVVSVARKIRPKLNNEQVLQIRKDFMNGLKRKKALLEEHDIQIEALNKILTLRSYTEKGTIPRGYKQWALNVLAYNTTRKA